MVIRKCVPNSLGRATDKMDYSILTKEPSKLDKLTTLLITEYVTMMVAKLRYG